LLHPDQLFGRGLERLGEPYVGGLAGLELACMERNEATRAKKRGFMIKSMSYSDVLGRKPKRTSKENVLKGQSVASARKHYQQ